MESMRSSHQLAANLALRLRKRRSIGQTEKTKFLFELFEELGLTPHQAKVLVCLMRMGTRRASSVAEHAGMVRTRVYEALERLQKRNLVAMNVRRHVRFFTAISLDDLLSQIAKKEALLAKRRRQLKDVIKSLELPLPLSEESGTAAAAESRAV